MSEYLKRNLPPKLVDLTNRQYDYLKDWKHRFFIIPSGRRSRKTLIGKHKLIVQKALKNANKNYFLGAPVQHQAKAIFWDDLKRYTYYFRKDKSETELKMFLFNGTMIQVCGLDKAERIEGTPWHGCFITEVPNLKENAWGEHIRPVLSDTGGFAMLDGVPEGLNFYYDLALYATGGVIPKTKAGIGSFSQNPDDPEWCYYHWFSEDVLNPAEIDAAKMQLDERTYRQEYLGSFESYAGLAYWAFSEQNLKRFEYNPKETVHIGMDFNVDPMTAVFCHVRNDDIFQFGEAYLPHSNTYEMAEHVLSKFELKNVIIYPDSTGHSNTSNATRSDIEILKKAGFTIKARLTNPRQKDRINAVNSKLKAGDGKPHYFINPQSCPKTINDFNRVVSLADGRLDKSQEATGLIHITDGLGYLIHYLFPIKTEFKIRKKLIVPGI